MSERYKRRWVLAESDPHAGHKLGLCNPDAQILDPDQGIRVPPTLTEYQRYIWDLRTEYLNNVWEMAGNAPVVYIMGGDITHGKDHGEQLMASRQSDQRAIARANMTPVLERRNVKVLRFVTGTGVHVFGEGSSEIELVDRLTESHPRHDIGIAHHSRLALDGVVRRGPSRAIVGISLVAARQYCAVPPAGSDARRHGAGKAAGGRIPAGPLSHQHLGDAADGVAGRVHRVAPDCPAELVRTW